MKKYLSAFIIFIVCICLCLSCKQNETAGEAEAPAEVVTPVTLTHPTIENISQTVEVNAVSAYLLKTFVKANTNGYLQLANIHLGQFVSKGQTLFVIKTKEAEALGNTINKLDSSLHFQGTMPVTAPGSGYITQLTYTAGNYVQDGDQLAEITNTKSFVFILDLPYELKRYLPNNKTLQLVLPDSTMLTGYVQGALPTVDSVAQTQRIIIKVNTTKVIPENLLAKVSLVTTAKQRAVILPKAAVLSDEVQSAFWIMKMMNDSTAVKLPVQKGLETKDNIEIVSPQLSAADKVLLTGNYGLPDTAKVAVTKQ